MYLQMRKNLKIKTKLGLEFTLEVPEIEEAGRNILPVQLFNLSDHDEVINVEEVEGIDYFELNIGINEKGKLKAYKTVKEDLLKVKTNSLSELLI